MKLIVKLWFTLILGTSVINAQWDYDYDVGIMTGGIGGTYIKFGRDSMHLMNKTYENKQSFHNKKILVRPIVSAGSQNNLMALKKSPGVDLAIVQADVLKVYRENGSLGNLINELRYISYLYNEEIHIVVRKDSSIKYFKDLNDKKLVIGSKGSGTELTTKNIITLLDLRVKKINLSFRESMQKLKDKSVDAVVAVGGKPLSKFTPYLKDIKFLKVSTESLSYLSDSYVPATLTSSEYSNITETIETIAVPSILACYNWTKRNNISRFKGLEAYVKTLHNNLELMKKMGRNDNNKKWEQINFRKNVPGWERHSIVSRYNSLGNL